MSTITQHGYLLLADISAYTSFVAGTELDHSHEILSDLLETICMKIDKLLTIHKLEGDAVFAYAPESMSSRGETILELIAAGGWLNIVFMSVLLVRKRFMTRVSGDDRVLPRTTAGPLASHDGALDEQLPTPDAPRLLALEGAGEALRPCGAEPAEGLGELDVLRSLGEPELGVVVAARDGLADLLGLGPHVDQFAQLHRSHLRLRDPLVRAPLLTRLCPAFGPGPEVGTDGARLGPAARHPRSHLLCP